MRLGNAGPHVDRQERVRLRSIREHNGDPGRGRQGRPFARNPRAAGPRTSKPVDQLRWHGLRIRDNQRHVAIRSMPLDGDATSRMKARARVSYRLSQSGAVILYVDGELTVR